MTEQTQTLRYTMTGHTTTIDMTLHATICVIDAEKDNMERFLKSYKMLTLNNSVCETFLEKRDDFEPQLVMITIERVDSDTYRDFILTLTPRLGAKAG